MKYVWSPVIGDIIIERRPPWRHGEVITRVHGENEIQAVGVLWDDGTHSPEFSYDLWKPGPSKAATSRVMINHFEQIAERVIPEDQRKHDHFDFYEVVVHRLDHRTGLTLPAGREFFDGVRHTRVSWREGPIEISYEANWKLIHFLDWCDEEYDREQRDLGREPAR